jgi:hypothetical protein
MKLQASCMQYVEISSSKRTRAYHTKSNDAETSACQDNKIVIRISGNDLIKDD